MEPSSLLTPELTAILDKAEKAVDECGHFVRIGEASFNASRLGYTLLVKVKLVGSRKRPMNIFGDGDTLEASLERLIDQLDNWAEAIR